MPSDRTPRFSNASDRFVVVVSEDSLHFVHGYAGQH